MQTVRYKSIELNQEMMNEEQEEEKEEEVDSPYASTVISSPDPHFRGGSRVGGREQGQNVFRQLLTKLGRRSMLDSLSVCVMLLPVL